MQDKENYATEQSSQMESQNTDIWVKRNQPIQLLKVNEKNWFKLLAGQCRNGNICTPNLKGNTSISC